MNDDDDFDGGVPGCILGTILNYLENDSYGGPNIPLGDFFHSLSEKSWTERIIIVGIPVFFIVLIFSCVLSRLF
ncbi:MAG: hypothetical protein D6768_01820 [Chloroflexi bacterium]|nr:MAG: hypothetical protein D6768_01820 [Chloroflexota bacterium]